jgi:hypothetical protein
MRMPSTGLPFRRYSSADEALRQIDCAESSYPQARVATCALCGRRRHPISGHPPVTRCSTP